DPTTTSWYCPVLMGPSPASPMDFWSTATPAASSPAATPWATGSSRRSEPYKTSARTSRSLPVIGPTAEPRRLAVGGRRSGAARRQIGHVLRHPARGSCRGWAARGRPLSLREGKTPFLEKGKPAPGHWTGANRSGFGQPASAGGLGGLPGTGSAGVRSGVLALEPPPGPGQGRGHRLVARTAPTGPGRHRPFRVGRGEEVGGGRGVEAAQLLRGQLAEGRAQLPGVGDQGPHRVVGLPEGDAFPHQAVGQLRGRQVPLVRGRPHPSLVHLQ